MSDDLTPTFEQLLSGARSPEAFAQKLLALCKERPECAWESLALLDQYYRRGKISADVQQSLRGLLGRQALRSVGGRPAVSPARSSAPAALSAARPSRRPGSARLASLRRESKSRALLRSVPVRTAPPPPALHTPVPPSVPMEIDDEEPTIETLAPGASACTGIAQPTAPAETAAIVQSSGFEPVVPVAGAAATPGPEAAPAAGEAPSKDAGRVWPAALIAEPARRERPARDGAKALVVARVDAASRGPRWRACFRTSPVIALAAVVLAVAATPTVHETTTILPAAAGMPGAVATASDATAAVRQSTPSAMRADDTLSLSSERYVVGPDHAFAEISVVRSADAGGDTSFLWWTEPSGAKPDQDYVGGAPRRAQIADGASSAKLHIPILANPRRHHVEMFYVVIGRPSGEADLGPVHRAAVFILPPQRH